MKKKLGRYKQCEKCPWKMSTDPHDIPNGYSADAHRALENTIADPASLKLGGVIHTMACHDSPVGKESQCIGWLVHQMGPGNNIALRLLMRHYDLSGVELVGEQHQNFEDTLDRQFAD